MTPSVMVPPSLQSSYVTIMEVRSKLTSTSIVPPPEQGCGPVETCGVKRACWLKASAFSYCCLVKSVSVMLLTVLCVCAPAAAMGMGAVGSPPKTKASNTSDVTAAAFVPVIVPGGGIATPTIGLSLSLPLQAVRPNISKARTATRPRGDQNLTHLSLLIANNLPIAELPRQV